MMDKQYDDGNIASLLLYSNIVQNNIPRIPRTMNMTPLSQLNGVLWNFFFAIRHEVSLLTNYDDPWKTP